MTIVQNVALKDRTGQAWPLSPRLTGTLEHRPSDPHGDSLLLPADEVPDGLRPDDVAAVSAQHPELQPSRRVEDIELQNHPGEQLERWMLRLGEKSADAENPDP